MASTAFFETPDARPPETGPASLRHGGSLHLVPVSDRAALRRFVEVPWSIYADDGQWVPPLRIERLRHLDPARNPYFRHADTAFWIAMRGTTPVGRISAQHEHPSDGRPDREAIGHFGCFEAIDDPKVFAALFEGAESWLARRGIRQVRGPFSLSINDECGLLIEGFDTQPTFLMGHAPRYYARRFEQAGYAKAKDLYAYQHIITEALPPVGRRMLHRLGGTRRIVVRPLDRRRYDREIRTVLDIFNDAWAGNWGFVPLTEAELEHLARELKPLIDPDLVAIGMVDDEPAAMMVALPDLNQAIADLNGRLAPFGWAKLFWRLKAGRIRRLRVPLMGVRRSHRGSLPSAALMVRMFETLNGAAHRKGYREAELSWVLEDNAPMRHVIESFGARSRKVYRVYEKTLS